MENSQSFRVWKRYPTIGWTYTGRQVLTPQPSTVTAPTAAATATARRSVLRAIRGYELPLWCIRRNTSSSTNTNTFLDKISGTRVSWEGEGHGEHSVLTRSLGYE